MRDDRICKEHDRTDMIRLTCRNHPTLRWSTKNIGGIGHRSIFFIGVLSLVAGSNEVVRTLGTEECECPSSDLIHVCDKE
jgi:hypothetical protein